MSDTIFDGGPANPIGNEPGISVREFFASAVISGMYAAGVQASFTEIATTAFKQADEMLKARTQLFLTPSAEPEAPAPEAPEPEAP